MIQRLQLLRNVGQFDSATTDPSIVFARLTLLFAENGRGKTTVAAILRSLATGDPIPITERKRLAATNDPHLIIACSGGAQPAIFQNGAWSRTLSNVSIFDDTFVDQNVSSGLGVGTEHRQGLHELILGAQGVQLHRDLEAIVTEIERHNTELREKAAGITARGHMPIDAFCRLPPHEDIRGAILDTERQIEAVRDQETILRTRGFEGLALPKFDDSGIEELLHTDLPTLDSRAAAQVQQNIARLGNGGETWLATGLQHLGDAGTDCPFCTQNIDSVGLLGHYRAYFGSGYKSLQSSISTAINEVQRIHGGDSVAAFERQVKTCAERAHFWSRYADVPAVEIDTAEISRLWRVSRQSVLQALASKQAAPLESMRLTQDAREAIQQYEVQRQSVEQLNLRLQDASPTIALVKERSTSANLAALNIDLLNLRAVESRYSPRVDEQCNDYLTVRAAKEATEHRRATAKDAIDEYRATIFPTYQQAVNTYLQRFNAGFRIGGVTSVTNRGGAACNYNIVINDVSVAVTGAPQTGAAAFRNTLSAGDRNTLALAFFFASLDQDPDLGTKAIVVDDPLTSLDDHRSLTTAQELRRLANRAQQLIVLSHSKPFLSRIWEGANRDTRKAIQLVRDGQGSELQDWEVDEDAITEHDRRHQLLRDFVLTRTPNSREVAEAIRPVLEAFVRVAYPMHFPPGSLLGPFRQTCERNLGTRNEVLNAPDAQTLRDLIEYANQFHHDTNAAWQTHNINEGELLGFAVRTLSFTKR